MSKYDRVPKNVKSGFLNDEEVSEILLTARVRDYKRPLKRYQDTNEDYVVLHVEGSNALRLAAHIKAKNLALDWLHNNPAPKDFAGSRFKSKFNKSL